MFKRWLERMSHKIKKTKKVVQKNRQKNILLNKIAAQNNVFPRIKDCESDAKNANSVHEAIAIAGFWKWLMHRGCFRM